LLVGSVATMFCLAGASADVVLEQRTTMSGIAGIAGEGTSTLSIAGDRQRTDGTFKMKGLIGKLAGGSETIQIVRLDKGIVWDIDRKGRSYTEMTLAQMRSQIEQGMAALSGNDDKKDQRKFDWTLDVKNTGANEKIAGFDAKQTVVRVRGRAYDEKEKKEFLIDLGLDLWLAEGIPADAEIAAFQQKFADSLGMDPRAARGLGGFLRRYGDGFDRLSSEMRKAKGVPVRSTWSVEMPQATDAGESGVLASITTETTAIRVGPVPGTQFDLPADLERKEVKLSGGKSR
jgi:uncharacterized protein (UPF0335 family)